MSLDGADDDQKSTIATWKDRYRSLYDSATHHPFVLSIRDGTVDIQAFKRWLGQDYIFVREFVPFGASVLLKAWKKSDAKSDMEVVLGGLASLNDELSWFKKEASRWGVDLDNVIPQKTNLEYCSFLQSLIVPEVEYSIVMTAIWAIEAVYQQSFSHCLGSGNKTPAELMDTCHRWGSDGFGQYCISLQKIADRSLEKARADIRQKAEEAFICVLEHEIKFWNMSSGES